MAMLGVVEVFDMVEILILLVRGPRVFFILPTLTRSFLSSLPHLPDEGQV